MNRLHYGVAYYDEYMPSDRLEQDIELMRDAGITVVRIAESTWSTHEPQPGVFDFASVDRVLDAMHRAGISVIVGTPTYAIPAWLARLHPEALAVTPHGQRSYGARQNMDITSPAYRFYAERIIRRLIGRVCEHPAVIGYQADNETKAYGTAGPNVQLMFTKHLRETFGTLEALNRRFGLDYWSNRVESWEDMPSAVGTINASLGAEFAKFQRRLVTEFLAWQVSIINEYRRPGQFVMQNFDLEWRGFSFGVQPDVDHFAAAAPFDVAGIDIYHPSQSELTGTEIAFGGDVARSLKRAPYLVVETQAQGFAHWTPFPGQLRLQAFSHLASGANMVAYWHWHSIHNSFETYWKGLLSHDLAPNPVYEEARTIGADFARLSERLVNLRKPNRVALLVSNESLSGIEAFRITSFKRHYNDVVRLLYDALYRMNVPCDIIGPAGEHLEEYALVVVPALYAAPDALLERLNAFVHAGGHAVFTFKSGFADEFQRARAVPQPGIISAACGASYSLFVEPKRLALRDDPFGVGEAQNVVADWAELLTPTTAEALAWYDHPHWGRYAAATRNTYGAGAATYIGCMPSAAIAERVLEQAARAAGLWGADQELRFPLVVRSGVNQAGRTVRFYLNYSDEPASFAYPHGAGVELLGGAAVRQGDTLAIERWGVLIVEEGERR